MKSLIISILLAAGSVAQAADGSLGPVYLAQNMIIQSASGAFSEAKDVSLSLAKDTRGNGVSMILIVDGKSQELKVTSTQESGCGATYVATLRTGGHSPDEGTTTTTITLHDLSVARLCQIEALYPWSAEVKRTLEGGFAHFIELSTMDVQGKPELLDRMN